MAENENKDSSEEQNNKNDVYPTDPLEQNTTNDGEIEGANSSASASTIPTAAEPEEQSLQEKLLRAAAELDNTRKRARKDAEDALRRGGERVIRDILPVFDNLERALGASENASDVKSVIEGLQMVLSQFEDVGEKLGLKKVNAMGEVFNPAHHEAIQKQPSDEHPPGTVIAEVAPGYMYQGKLLRAAMVVVSEGVQKPEN